VRESPTATKMENATLAVDVRNVSKAYPVFASPASRLRQLLLGGRAHNSSSFWALRDVTVQIARGETFCVVGQNGSGKSTLLQLIARIFPPTQGEIKVHGKLAALLELGAGFNPEFTGRENVFLNGSLLGLSRAELQGLLPHIEDFAEIGSFLDQPVKTYSSGMLVRLAFAVAVHVDPEILIVDEALAVGDIYFRQRCMRKVHELKRNGATIIYVTHSAADVRAIGDTCLWLDKGSIREIGDPEAVVSHYLAEMTTRDGRYLEVQARKAAPTSEHFPLTAPELVEGIPNIDHRYGDQRAEVIGVALTDAAGQPLSLLRPHHDVVFRVSVLAKQYIASPIVGYVLRNHLGLDLAVSNTLREGLVLPSLGAGQSITVDFHLTMPELYPSNFAFSAAIADGDLEGFVVCDFVENAVSIEMDRGVMPVYGYLHLPCRIGVNQRLRTAVPEEALHG
jgi:lipopolysaccharide transport system ATP-binding protein